MGQRLLLAIVTCLGLSGVYGVYSVIVAPHVNVPERMESPQEAFRETDSARPQENMRVAEQHLAQMPWAAQAKYLLRTDEVFVYANEWVPDGAAGQIRFRPFAAVFLSTNSEGEERAVTVSAESAVLVFATGFALESPNPGHVTRGALGGQVRITGPEGLEILGEDFFFNEGMQSIYSQSRNQRPVQFRVGKNRGQADHLRMQLIRAEQPIASDRPNVVGIESVTLSQNVKMELMLEQPTAEPQSVPQSPAPSPLYVRCTDQFVYHVVQRTALFEGSVFAYRKQGQFTQGDRLWCDRLTLTFNPQVPAGSGVPAVPPNPEMQKLPNGYQKLDQGLEFNSMIAESNPHPKDGSKPKPVHLASEQHNLKAWMTTLTYQSKHKTIVMGDVAGVHIQQRDNQLLVPEMHIALNDDYTVFKVVCLGPGWLQALDEHQAVIFRADWMKSLTKSTDPSTKLDLIEFEQDALVQQPTRDSALGANRIQLWFRAPPPNTGANQELELMNPLAAEPKRMLATQQVAFISPQVEYEGQQLEIVFEEKAATPEPATPPISQRTRPVRWAHSPIAKTATVREQHVQPAAMASVPPENLKPLVPEPPTSGDTDAATGDPPLEVLSEKMWIRVLPITQPDQPPQVAEIWSIGQVHIKQPTKTGDLRILEGSKLQIQNKSPTDQVVHVFGETGRPAHLRDEQQKLHIEGQTIHLDRASNLAWVDGAGLLQLPVPATLDGQPLSEPMLLDVWWKEQMDFDGLLATFDGDVRAKLDTGTMQCRSMQVELSDRISFTEQMEQTIQPKLQSVTCRDGVEFENIRSENGQLLEIQKAKVFELSINNLTQETSAQGPGWMQMWRRGTGNRAGLVVMEKQESNRVSKEPLAEWEYTRVDFSDGMKGHIGQRWMSFRDRVEVIYGQVQRPVDVIDPHQLPKAAGTMRCDTLEVDQSEPDGQGKSYVQLTAKGNSHLEGRGFSARADEISYDQSIGMFTLRSLGRYKATIWRDQAKGEQQNRTDGQRMEFTPSTGKVKVIKSTGGIGGT